MPAVMAGVGVRGLGLWPVLRGGLDGIVSEITTSSSGVGWNHVKDYG